MIEEGYETPGNTASASTSRSAEKPKGKGKVESVTIRPAEGGFIVTCYKVSRGNSLEEPKDNVFTTFDEAMGYVAEELGQSSAPPAEPMMADAPPTPESAPPPPMGGDGMPPRPKNTSAYLA